MSGVDVYPLDDVGYILGFWMRMLLGLGLGWVAGAYPYSLVDC